MREMEVGNYTEVAVRELLLKDVHFVEEENDRLPVEPIIIDGVLEQLERFHHSVGFVVFFKHLVIRDQELRSALATKERE